MRRNCNLTITFLDALFLGEALEDRGKHASLEPQLAPQLLARHAATERMRGVVRGELPLRSISDRRPRLRCKEPVSKAAGIEYDALIAEILSGAIRRYKERERERRTGARALDLSKPLNGNGSASVPPPPAPEALAESGK